MSWFECKVKFDKMMDDGIQKTVTEAYLVDALSFTEAEARITEEMEPYISGDETPAGEKRSALFQIVQASAFSQALSVFMDGMKDTHADFEIASITETMLMDVFGANLTKTVADKAEN